MPSIPALKPLRHPTFRWIWAMTVVSNIGTWMQNVGAAWLMTELTASHTLIALLQTASSLPVVLLSIPAGALADILDRRRYLLAVQGWNVAVAGTLAVCAWLGLLTPWLLLALTFAIGAGVAMAGPAWFSSTPELVPEDDLQEAVTLNGIGINLARVVGPAVAGLILSFAGPPVTFLLNAVSFIALIPPLWFWKRAPQASALPAEPFLGGIRAGLRYARQSNPLHRIFTHAFPFFFCASSVWALLPILAREQFQLDAGGYGALLGSMGIGALAGALLLPGIRLKLSRNRVVLYFSLLYGLCGLILSHTGAFFVACFCLLAMGCAWIAVVSTLHVTAQQSLHAWVKGRGLSLYLMVFQCGMALGSLFWGVVAETGGGEGVSLLAASGLLVMVAVALSQVPLPLLDSKLLAPSRHWQDLDYETLAAVAGDAELAVTIDYIVPLDEQPAFFAALGRMEAIRRRDGATSWEVYQDMADHTRITEHFTSESLIEHMRQHERVSHEDRLLQEAVNRHHRSELPPQVTHSVMIAGKVRDAARKKRWRLPRLKRRKA